MKRFIELVNVTVFFSMIGGALDLGALGIWWLIALELSHLH